MNPFEYQISRSICLGFYMLRQQGRQSLDYMIKLLFCKIFLVIYFFFVKIRILWRKSVEGEKILLDFTIFQFVGVFFKNFLKGPKDLFDLDDSSNCMSSNYMNFTVYDKNTQLMHHTDKFSQRSAVIKASLAWLSVRLRTTWLWVQILLQSYVALL